MQKMIKRAIQNLIDEKLFKGKAIILYGARQTGKTTILKEYQIKFSDISIYFNCDDPVVSEYITDLNTSSIKNFVNNKKLLLIDEAQRVKNIGIKLKLIIDNYPDIQVVASGSSSFELSNEVNEPLTGRKFEYIVYPFSIGELIQEFGIIETKKKLENLIIYGMYPEIITKPDSVRELLFNLSGSYLYKDIFQWQEIRRPELLDKLLKAIALQIGSEVSYFELANLIGANVRTVESYLLLLEKTFVLFRLGSFSRNLRNELKKKQKIYFWDTGVRNAILGNFSPLELRTDKGALWENFVISERLKRNGNAKYYCNYYFWRTLQQQEIDYIEEKDGKLFVYEIKYSGSKKVKFPSTFMNAYPEIEETDVLTKTNIFEFLDPLRTTNHEL